MNKKTLAIILGVIIAIVIIIVILVNVFTNNDVETVLEENSLKSNMEFETTSISYIQLNAKSGMQYDFEDGTRVWKLEYDKDSKFFKNIKDTNRLYIEGTDVDFDVTVKGNYVYYILKEGTNLTEVMNIID